MNIETEKIIVNHFNKSVRIICIFSLACAIIISCSFALVKLSEEKKGNATAEQREGIYIFILSKPVTAYDTQGSVKKSFALSGSPEEMLNALIKKCKKDYPGADGLIFTSLSMDKADCIKFK